jgi:hypothetical protein
MLPERLERTETIADLSNEYATIALSLDQSGNDPRLRVCSVRDHTERLFDATALSLLCHVDATVLAVLADIARDPSAGGELAEWLAQRRTRANGSASTGS